jgi:hypothetical protein
MIAISDKVSTWQMKLMWTAVFRDDDRDRWVRQIGWAKLSSRSDEKIVRFL